MPSKGVDVYAYLAVPGSAIEVSVPKHDVRLTELNRFHKVSMEVDAKAISSFLDKRGRFTFKVFHNNKLVTEQWINVNALTGNASGGTMEVIAQTPSIFWENKLAVCYGLYEAGPGHGLLPNRHQCYVTVTPIYENYIRDLAPPGSPLEKKPFTRFVLPSPHDVGMNTMDSTHAILKKVGGAIVAELIHNNKYLSALTDALAGRAIALLAPNIIFSLAITQKDSLETLLRLGARYFEFRPARCHRAVLPTGALTPAERHYFQHSAIPGMAYDAFLKGVVNFLKSHPAEIIVVQLRWDGVPTDVCAPPTAEEKRKHLDDALRGSDIVAGNLDDMRRRTVAELRRDRKRLIMLDSVDSLSTYGDDTYATLDGESILRSLPGVLAKDKQRGKAFVNIQCQATPSNIPKAVAYSVIGAGETTSVLMATKGVCDHKILPWVRDNVLKTVELEHLVVLMNDWLEGGTVDVAYKLSKQRLEK
ncbi:hypothetical protein VTJ04DRAFT_1313 [Mycothermus thermophilus]|uniref:uncharacterized protein n=1 Tax=Humicola insolens TaxID=85995 RepID=UPI003743A772